MCFSVRLWLIELFTKFKKLYIYGCDITNTTYNDNLIYYHLE